MKVLANDGISESGKNSPVRNLFSSTKSIIHVRHMAIDYYKAMLVCVNTYNESLFYDRADFLKVMSTKSVCTKFLSIINLCKDVN